MAKNQPFDYTTLKDGLETVGDLDEIGEAFIYEIVNSTPTAANVVSYAKIVREKAILRQAD